MAAGEMARHVTYRGAATQPGPAVRRAPPCLLSPRQLRPIVLQELPIRIHADRRQDMQYPSNARFGRQRRRPPARRPHVGGHVTGRHGDDRKTLCVVWRNSMTC